MVDIVRDNLMHKEGYTGYCGSVPARDENGKVIRSTICSWPRTKFDWKTKQFHCPQCSWVSKFNDDFIERYIAKWGFDENTKFKPKWGI